VVQGGSTYPINYHGLFASAQRYALDVVQLNDWGVRAAGLHPERLSAYEIYGAPVYSPLTGTVVDTAGHFPDLTTGERMPEHPAGNHVWLRRARTGHSPPDADRPVAEALRVEREKLDEQIRVLDTVLWWYIAPLAVGILLVVGGDAGLSWFTLGYGAVVVALGAGAYYLNQREVRTHLRPRRAKLTRMLRRVEEGARQDEKDA
jgi:hypothetical protein